MSLQPGVVADRVDAHANERQPFTASTLEPGMRATGWSQSAAASFGQSRHSTAQNLRCMRIALSQNTKRGPWQGLEDDRSMASKKLTETRVLGRKGRGRR